MKRFFLFAARCLCLTFIVSIAQAQTSLTLNTLSTASGNAQSTSVKLKATVGQSLVGVINSTSLKSSSGFDASVAIDQIPDLFFSSTPSINPTTVTRGSTFDLFLSLKNGGTALISLPVLASVFLSGNQVLDDSDRSLTSAATIVSELKPGESFSNSQAIKISIPIDVSPGAYYVLVMIDPQLAIKERNENNNIGLATISVTSDDDNIDPIILPPAAAPFSENLNVTATVTDNKQLKAVYFAHRSIAGSGFDSTMVTGNGSNFTVLIQNSWADQLGVEGYFFAIDNAGNWTATNHLYWYKTPEPSATIPFVSAFGGTTLTYEMFSIPFQLKNDNITSIFDEISEGVYDKARWRVYHYGGSGQYEENATMSITPGLGYWINMKEKIAIKIGAGSVVAANQTAPFQINLQQGWNQIGNPFPFTISWSKVNKDDDAVDELNFYEQGKYVKSDDFKPWLGAFVYASKPTTIEIPVVAKSGSGRTNNSWTEDAHQSSWFIPLDISIGDFGQQGGVGMHPRASKSKDRFDEITLPRFRNYAELNSKHPEFVSWDFATDVVPPGKEFSWTFLVNSNLIGEAGVIRWDSEVLRSSEASLLLIDELDRTWVDMKIAGSYTFKHVEGRSIRIVYSESGNIDAQIVMLGNCYPNPFTEQVVFPVMVDHAGEYQIQIFNAIGQRVRSLHFTSKSSGPLEVVWDGFDDNGRVVSPGIFVYRLSGFESIVKRAIKR